MNTLESLNKIDIKKNIENFSILQREIDFKIPGAFSNFLQNHSVVKPKLSFFKKENIKFYINYFFGFSENKYQDFFHNYSAYFNRMPPELFPIASVDGGNLLCMDKEDGSIYYWFHEENDWGLEENKERPLKIASNLNELIEVLIESENPTVLEIELAKKQAKIIKTTPLALKFKNEARAKKGLPPLTMEDFL